MSMSPGEDWWTREYAPRRRTRNGATSSNHDVKKHWRWNISEGFKVIALARETVMFELVIGPFHIEHAPAQRAFGEH